MTGWNGWTGTVLRVDLSKGRVTKEPLNERWARAYVGGRGLGARCLYEEMDPRADALSPENKLIFATGPLTGTNASCGARYMVVTKGPLTDCITTSNSGGTWGPELKFAGYDMVILEGASPRPVALFIHDDEVALRPADRWWGSTVSEADDGLRAEAGVPDAVVACIGPAGERRVRYAAVMNDKHRAAGRSGVGAVMGAKNLKAIVVRGTGAVRIADPAAFMVASWSMKAKVKKHPVTGGGLPTYGTNVLMNVINEHGALPTRNHLEAQLAGANKIGGETLRETRLVANKACFACTIACGRVTRLPASGIPHVSVTTHPRNWKVAGEGPEYENSWSLGAACGIDDLDAVIAANFLCNDLGMDPISFGATLAAAMELYGKGVLSEKETGMPLRFGDGRALVAMAERTGWREGFGDALAEGSKRLGERYGHPEVFMGVRGQEFPAYDARAIQGMGLGYATSNRGACHLKSYTVSPEILGIPMKLDPAVTEGKAAVVKLFQDATSSVDATGLCLFLTFGVGVEDMVPQLAAATGVPYTVEEVLRAGERIWNLERVWNMRAGDTGKEDTLPRRLLAEPIPAGPTKGKVNRLGEMLPEYYRLRGWTPDGQPSAAKLIELGIL